MSSAPGKRPHGMKHSHTPPAGMRQASVQVRPASLPAPLCNGTHTTYGQQAPKHHQASWLAAARPENKSKARLIFSHTRQQAIRCQQLTILRTLRQDRRIPASNGCPKNSGTARSVNLPRGCPFGQSPRPQQWRPSPSKRAPESAHPVVAAAERLPASEAHGSRRATCSPVAPRHLTTMRSDALAFNAGRSAARRKRTSLRRKPRPLRPTKNATHRAQTEMHRLRSGIRQESGRSTTL